MKMLLKTFAAVAIFACSAASAATVVINMTGSTAFRAAANNAIKTALGSGVTYAYNEATAGDGLNKANYAIYSNVVGSDTIIVRVFWAGSVEGVSYPSDGVSRNVFYPTNTTRSTTGTALSNTAPTDPGVVDAGMSDVFKGTAGFPNADLGDTQVGVVPFVFITNTSAPISNMTPQLMRMVYNSFTAYVSNFDPTSSSMAPVYGCGRTPDSGTRIQVLAETGYGYTNPVVQFTASNNGTSLTGFTPNASGGNSGATSGGTLAKTLIYTSNDSVGYGVAYVGASDVQGANKKLTYNGADFTAAHVINGSYTLWGYEHCFVAPRVRDAAPSTADDTRRTWLNSYISALQTDPSASSGIKLSDMLVTRAGDGTEVQNN